jgi:DNA-binding NtrC family response regulator
MVRQLLELRIHTDEIPAEAVPPNEADLHMPNVVELANKAAPTDCTVLINGESGVGKEVLGDYITRKSLRCNEPYVKVDCAAITETLVESELFGHERGAFTGANKRHVGRVERANKGTLFLDEIGELSLSMQTKLLRVLQTHEIERVGGTGEVKVDFRLICATHRDLRKMVSEGRFRQDLFYRINTFPIQIPPLRDRRDEIPALARMFLKRYRTMLQRGPTEIGSEALAMLQSYPWPGNVRELEHCLERACLLAPQSYLQTSDVWWLGSPAAPVLPAVRTAPALSAPIVKPPVTAPQAEDAPGPELTPLEKAEFIALKQTLDKYNWNFTRAAQALGISRSTLYLKASKYDLNRAEASS